MSDCKYGFGKIVDLDFDTAIERITAALKEEGFGILTQIDAQATLKTKLDVDILPYKILGACNPSLAHQAIQAEPSIGLLLPCNVLVRQDEAGAVHIEIMDPNAVLTLVDKPSIEALAATVREKLDRALSTL
ncbi:MAG: DUF302 domain-containing protein [Candidatus Polarisedimenticolaceae bacterium]|nr:DUF302 domain-containing protein [Candidatus Polarisedimenticolaceae bacterium]